jgi:chromosome segregation ATPase
LWQKKTYSERIKKMKTKLAIVFLAALCCLLGLSGCKDAEKEEALKETAELRTELIRVKGILTKTEIERDELKAKVSELSESLKAAQTKIDDLMQSSSQAVDITEQLARLTEQRDTAIAKATDAQTLVEKLGSQLQEQLQKSAGLENENKKLQETIDELQKKLDSEVEIPSLPKL